MKITDFVLEVSVITVSIFVILYGSYIIWTSFNFNVVQRIIATSFYLGLLSTLFIKIGGSKNEN